MGVQLLGYYEKVGKEFGVKGRMKLALLTMITSMTAGTEDDSPANLQKFERAIAQIRKAGVA
jgi:hypothetical protein